MADEANKRPASGEYGMNKNKQNEFHTLSVFFLYHRKY